MDSSISASQFYSAVITCVLNSEKLISSYFLSLPKLETSFFCFDLGKGRYLQEGKGVDFCAKPVWKTPLVAQRKKFCGVLAARAQAAKDVMQVCLSKMLSESYFSVEKQQCTNPWFTMRPVKVKTRLLSGNFYVASKPMNHSSTIAYLQHHGMLYALKYRSEGTNALKVNRILMKDRRLDLSRWKEKKQL